MNLFKILFPKRKPTICVHCEHCTSDMRCLAHPYPVEIDLVTGKSKRYFMDFPNLYSEREERVYTTDLHFPCRRVNNGRCRHWTDRAFGPVTIVARQEGEVPADRQTQFHEFPSLACFRPPPCLFLNYDGGCNVPGGACWKRAIAGIPDYYVKDILQAAGLIAADWPQDKREGNQEDESNEQ